MQASGQPLVGAGGVDAVRRPLRVVVADRSRRLARRRVLHPQLAERGADGLDHGDVDPGGDAVAAAGGDGGHRGPCCGEPGARIADGDAGLRRVAAVVAVGRVEPGEGAAGGPVRHVLGVGAVLAEPAERHHDHVGVDGPQVVDPVAQRRHRAGREVVDHHVGAGHQATDDLAGGLAAQVERQAALVGVVDLEQAVGVGRRLDVGRVERQPAEQAEVLGRLQADDVGAEVGEQLGAVGAGPDPGEVADADALEGALRCAGRPGRFAGAAAALARPMPRRRGRRPPGRRGAGPTRVGRRGSPVPAACARRDRWRRSRGCGAARLLAAGPCGRRATRRGGLRWPARNSSSADCSAIHSDRYSSIRSAFSRRCGDGGEHVQRRPLGRAHQLDQAPPLGVLDADELQQAVAALVDAPRHDVAHADPGGVLAQERGGDRRRLGHAGRRRQAREVDVVADAAAPGPVDRGQEGGGGHGGGEQRGVVAGRLERRLVEVGRPRRARGSPCRRRG